MTTVLLTGAAGFIGHHTVAHLLDTTDWDIVALDALTYAGEVARLTDLPNFDPNRVRILWHDLRAPITEPLAERIGWPDHIINMASDSHVERSITDPAPFVTNNVALAVNMLEYARTLPRLQTFIQVSTDEVYGPAPQGYAHHEWDVIAPSNPYSASKASQEAIAFSYWRTYGVPVVITNTMNNFGSWQHPEKFVPMVVRNHLSRRTTMVHGRIVSGCKVCGADGPMSPHDAVSHDASDLPYAEHFDWEVGSRVWLHARNHADAIRFLLTEAEVPVYSDEVARPLRVNVVGEVELSNLDIVLKVAELLGVEPDYKMVDFHTSRPGHDMRYALDGSKLAEMGWQAPIGFEEAFLETVEWYARGRISAVRT